LRVLSLFDGMSCGQIALNRAGIKYEEYYASEIKPSAIKVTQYNYPDTIQLGDVIGVKGEDLPKIDLLMGGSPCQDFSIARTVHEGELGERKGLKGDKSRLFYEYLRLLEELKPKYFLLENVRMGAESEAQLNEYLGVKGIHINSNLVSYQNRHRIYWTNIPGVTLPTDKGISFQNYKDIDHDYCKRFKVNRTPSREIMWGDGVNGKCPNVTERDKVNCLTRKQDRWSNSGLVEFEDFCRYLTRRELEQAQTVPIGYTDPVSDRQAEDLLGDGWTVDIIVHILKFMGGEIKWLKSLPYIRARSLSL